MGRRSRRQGRQRDGAAARIGKQKKSKSPARKTGSGRLVLWSITGLLAVAAVAVAWTVLQKAPPRMPKASSVDSSRVAAPAENSDTVKQGTVAGSPKISFPETEHDFGTIAQGSKVAHKFVVRNTGDAPLRLIRAQGT